MTVLKAACQSLKRDEVPEMKDVEDPAGWLKKYLHTESLDQTGVIRITFNNGCPKTRATLVNVIVNAYMQENVLPERKRLAIAIHSMKNGLESEKRINDTRTRMRKEKLDLQEKDASLLDRVAREKIGMARRSGAEEDKERETRLKNGWVKLRALERRNQAILKTIILELAELPEEK